MDSSTGFRPTIINDGPHEIDEEAVASAMRTLGVTRPVVIKWHAPDRLETFQLSGHPDAFVGGGHSFIGDSHIMFVNPMQSIGAANESLWHELTHAGQMDKFANPMDYNHRYANESRLRGYQRNRYELEADRVANRMAPIRPLIKRSISRSLRGLRGRGR